MASGSGASTVDWLTPGLSYGVVPDADLSHVAIVRGSLSQPQLTVVDYGAIIKGKVLDVALEPGDIVYVPNTPYATFEAIPEHHRGHLYHNGSRQRRHPRWRWNG